ncbi:hypothetical protein AGMMS49990_00290 [Endomicrobiia bacterium]|nr:hypothetical protein AGMMS49990_00290 [Endomicrobiia bacterium]
MLPKQTTNVSMNKSIIKIIIVSIFIFLPALSAFAAEVDIAAESLEYLETTGKIIARGNVVLNWKDKKIYADNVEFNINTKAMNAYGNVKVEESGSLVRANTVSYNYNDESGEVSETFAYSSSVFVRSKSMKKLSKDKTFALHDIKLSVCDLDEPHIYFKAKRGEFVANERITLYNAWLCIGKMPVLPIPIFRKSLKPDKEKGFGANLEYGIEPGYNADNITLEAFIKCSLSENFDGKIKYDRLSAKHNKYGLEIGYENDNASGRIDTSLDNNNGKKDWYLKPEYRHKLNDQWTVRPQVDITNTDVTNNKYSKYSINAIRQDTNTHLSLDTCVNIDRNKASSRYNKPSSALLPKVAFEIYRKDIGMGIIHRPRFEYTLGYGKHPAQFGEEQNSKENYFFKNTGLIGNTFTKRFPFASNKIILIPSVEIAENYCDKDNEGNYQKPFYTQYGCGSDTTLELTEWWKLRTNYSYKLRTEPNRFFDRAVNREDYGIEVNTCRFTNEMQFLDDKLKMENTINYSWLRKRSHERSDDQKWSPLTTELTCDITKRINIHSKETHNLKHNGFKAFDLDVNVKLGSQEENFLKFGVVLEKEKDRLDAKNTTIKPTFGFGVWITPKWRWDFSIGAKASKINSSDLDFNKQKEVEIAGYKVEITDYKIKVYRDMHCFDCSIKLGKDKRFALGFSLKI